MSGEKKKTELLSENEITRYIDNNNLSIQDKMRLELREDVKQLLVQSGADKANIETLSQSINTVKKEHLECPARIAFETGGRIFKFSKKVPVLIAVVTAIITVGALLISKVITF